MERVRPTLAQRSLQLYVGRSLPLPTPLHLMLQVCENEMGGATIPKARARNLEALVRNLTVIASLVENVFVTGQ